MNILILSSHRALVECLERILSKGGRYAVRHGTDVEDGMSGPGGRGTDLILVDLGYPVDDLELLFRRRDPSVKILLLGFDPAAEPGNLRWLEAGVDGSLPLDAGLEDMVDAIERILQGEKIYPPKVAFLLFERLAQKARERDVRQRLEALVLTRRELQVLRLLGRRRSNDGIAGELGISIHTVKNHVHNILRKLKVKNRASAVDLAFRRGWLGRHDGERTVASRRRSAAGLP